MLRTRLLQTLAISTRKDAAKIMPKDKPVLLEKIKLKLRSKLDVGHEDIKKYNEEKQGGNLTTKKEYSAASPGAKGLLDFFRDARLWGDSMTLFSSITGTSWTSEMLRPLSYEQLHEVQKKTWVSLV